MKIPNSLYVTPIEGVSTILYREWRLLKGLEVAVGLTEGRHGVDTAGSRLVVRTPLRQALGCWRSKTLEHGCWGPFIEAMEHGCRMIYAGFSDFLASTARVLGCLLGGLRKSCQGLRREYMRSPFQYRLI